MTRREILKRALYAAAAVSLPVSMLRPAAGAAATIAGAQGRRILRIVRRTIEVNGRAANVFGLLQGDGSQGLALAAGGLFDVTLRNEIAEPTIVHWHGLTPPWDQDGVPDAPMPLVASKADRQFRFPVGNAGTHWMHAHTLQEQSLLAAPLIVRDPAQQSRDEQEAVILLHDFSFSTPEELLARLKGGGGHDQTAATGHAGHGASAAPQQRATPPGMAMDLNDIEYDAYLANDRTLDDPEIVRVELGGRVRLRIINGATATAFTIDLGALEGLLVAVDGQDIEPVKGHRFPIAMGQRLDIRLELPRDRKALPILALREGARERTGLILAPAAAAISKVAPVGQSNGPVVDLTLEQSLRAAKPLIPRRPDKHFDLTLVGSMQGYAWGLEAKPEIVVGEKDRIEVTLLNVSMMAHPMHLHGHHFQVVAIDGRRFSGAVRDTVHILPHHSVTIAVDAINPGDWAFHCHHLYHMAAGMMTTMKYQA
jgi:FtsP/CotA-like multicopper oxidase with cupredoxin domain